MRGRHVLSRMSTKHRRASEYTSRVFVLTCGFLCNFRRSPYYNGIVVEACDDKSSGSFPSRKRDCLLAKLELIMLVRGGINYSPRRRGVPSRVCSNFTPHRFYLACESSAHYIIIILYIAHTE